MGTNTQSQQPGAYGAFGDAGTQALMKTASTPYQGTAPGGGAAQGVNQLAAALLAAQRVRQQKARLGVTTYGGPQAGPGMPTAPMGLGGAAATQPAQSGVMQSDPMAGMGTYA